MRLRRPLACLLALWSAACGLPEAEPEATFQDHDLATVEQGLGVGSVGGCSTGAVAPLTKQLIAELNCIQANTMVDFRKSNISVGSTVNPFLAPNAASALQSAVNASGTTLNIISAYRSVAQQYLLYRWWKAGLCGVPLAALPGRSNHQSGRAVDVSSYSTWISRLQSKGWTWLGASDPAHFDYLSAPNFGSRSVLAFQKLWNKNRSNKLVEDGAWGPASEAAMAASPAEGFPVSGCAPAAPQTGTLKGKVFALNPADPADLSRVLADATVKVDGKTLTTDATGLYTATLSVGTYVVTASAAGYQTATVSRAVTAGQTVWGSVGLVVVGTPDTQPPELQLASPADGAESDLAEVVLEGTASDAQGPLASFTASLNGGAAQQVAQAQGAFAHALKLGPGKNSVLLTAKDAAGNVTRATVAVTFRAGVEGFVTTEGEAGHPVAGAQVSLVDASGATVASGVSAQDGAFGFDLALVPVRLGLRVAAEGHAPYEAELEVSDASRLVWTVPLLEGDGAPVVRLLSPVHGEVVAAETVLVTGVVAGLVPAWVEVNAQRAALEPGGRFSVEVPLALGENVLQATAAGPDGAVVTGHAVVSRVTVDALVNDRRAVSAGCTAGPGAPLVALALLLLARRRRR